MRVLKLLVAGIVCLLLTTTTQADTIVIPITLASGTGVLERLGSARFSFANADGSFSFTVNTNSIVTNSPVNQCFPCAPGSTVNLSFVGSGLDFSGSGIYNGVNYFAFGIPFRINAGSVTLPSDGSGADFIVPFTFGGTIGLYESRNQYISGAPNFSLQLNGTGEALARFTPVFNHLELQSVLYQAPVLTPEPATIILLTTGLAGVGAVVRKRRKAHNTEA